MIRKKLLFLSFLLTLLTTFVVSSYALDIVDVAEGTYIIESKIGSNMVMDVAGASKEQGANIQLYKYNGSSAQKFIIKKTGDYYTITPECSKLKVDVKGGSNKSGANVWQYTSNNSDAQKWKFYNAGNGYYYIRCKIGDKALDVCGGKTSNGTNIQMYTLNQTNAQKWKLISAIEQHDKSSEWQWPMKGMSVTQKFGNKGHLGIDMKSSADTGVYAAADGKVVAVGLNGTGSDAGKIKEPKGNGYYVVIEHIINGKKVYSMYAHLKKDSIQVKKGQNIRKGSKIAVYGNTGNSTGRHLHFAITDTFKQGSYYGYTKSRKTFVENKIKENRTSVIFYNPSYVITHNSLPKE